MAFSTAAIVLGAATLLATWLPGSARDADQPDDGAPNRVAVAGIDDPGYRKNV
jgi:hypothetical protein